MLLRSWAANIATLAALTMAPASFGSAIAQGAGPGIQPAATYADIADLSDSAELVVRAQIRRMTRVEDARAPGLGRGHGRFYIKAKTRSLLVGQSPLGQSLVYLVDLPLDASGKPPPIKKRDVLLFARAVPGQPGELQLVARDGQLLWSEATEATLRTVLTRLVAADVPPRVTGVREIIHVPGNLAGSGETQIFLETGDRSAASITVRHHPGRASAWGVSFSELVADVSRPPQPETLEWYRLACFLPNALPYAVNLSASAASRQQALSDYRMVLGELGPCMRSRG